MARLCCLGILWPLCYVVLLQFETAKSTPVEIDGLKNQEIQRVTPERLDVNRRKRDLSTLNKEGHDHEAAFLIRAFDKDMVLQTKRNLNLLSSSFTVRSFNKDNSEVIHKAKQEHCYYQGTLRGKPESLVVLNTCHGLSGLIDDGETVYYIEPDKTYKNDGVHIIYPARDDQLKFSHHQCGNSDEKAKYTRAERSTHEAAHKPHHLRRFRRDIDDFYKKYLTTDETRYNELMFVADYEMYLGHKNDTKALTDRVIVLANAVDAIYQRINIRIVLVALEIWSNGDRIPRSRSGGTDLGNFKNYRVHHLMPRFHHDNAQLLSTWWWNSVAGVAYVTAMCRGHSVGVNRWSFGSIIGPYVVLAHEMGHNFGMGHDSGYCKCLTPRGCIMGGHKTRLPGFSNCSMNGLKRINDKCLYNVPTKIMNSACGNGIREEGEECDCGSEEMCKKDPCCEPKKCVLKAHAQCSDLHHKCCKNCLFKSQGTLCRSTKTDCDTPEYCTGDSRDCPSDVYIKDGYPCNRTNTLILGNTNFYSVVTRRLQPRIQARYVRINPQFWKSWICMRTELFGCSANEVNPTNPTPIKAYNGYCLQPKVAGCKPADGTTLLWRPQNGKACEEDYKQFRLSASGVLLHHCSGERVCPQNGATHNGVKIVISKTCSEENSKFVRTKGKSLKHVKSGKCIHTSGAWPGTNRAMVLWSGCDVTRLELWFMKQDCVVPLGLVSGKVKDSQITASSYRPKDLPKYGRVGNSKYWCAAEQKKTEYLQIDLGQTKTISAVQTQGRGNWYNWVTGYHLYYSNDGQRWTGYSQSGDGLHSNSMCYKGTCSETPDTQCRDLWGAAAKNGASGCYNKLNTENAGYGTCDPIKTKPCAAKHAACGQLQCLATVSKPALVDYGYNYTKKSLDSGEQCSAAKLKNGDSVGQGMVAYGTKCGEGKMCVGYKCQTFAELGIKQCPTANGAECAGRGVCLNTGSCHCDAGYDPAGGCVKPLSPRDGKWSTWSSWTLCDKGCDGGKRSRHRFCNNPSPAHQGKDCQGDRIEEESCNTQACPMVHSCRHLQQISVETNYDYPDGVYKIYPKGQSEPILAYCDMSRDGGGWTLLVTSHTNSWTADNVKLRNDKSPRLDGDYSILAHADSIKNNVNVKGLTFEYRLEAQSRGRWGGIWRSPLGYTFTSTRNDQTGVELVKKFDRWSYSNNGIEKRMPWVSGAKLTTSESATSSWWGSITGNDKRYHPAPWISGHLMEREPQYIWYWMREGPYVIPRSCMELQMRSYLLPQPVKDGQYIIKPPGHKETKTYCDVTRNGGGWTLLLTSASHNGWNKDNIKNRNSKVPSLTSDFSILGMADAIKDFDDSQDFFEYRIEADGNDHWGGIWMAPREYTFHATCDKQNKVKLVQKFDNWNAGSNLGALMPRLDLSPNILLTAASSLDDPSGSIVYNTGSKYSPSYIKGFKESPKVVRYWIREGTRRSCNDVKLHGVRAGNKYEDGFYMISPTEPAQYLPVFCDMTSDDGAFTLLVTSANGGWKRSQVPLRNQMRPSLSNDYSILKYGDVIKGLSNGAAFKYKMDANQRNHWGGVFSAPMRYSFLATNNRQTDVTLLKKFDNWEYSWWKSLNKRMPWFDKTGKANKALLTTSSSTTYYPSGSIIYGDKEWNPAYWIRKGSNWPGTIWYWVNEDDCDNNRQPVNGGLSSWSEWGRCDKLCDATGKERRQRTCTNPKPRCGGKTCDTSSKALEERSCNYCPESPIKSGDTGLCVQPESGACKPAEGTALIFKKADDKCSSPSMVFTFDYDGILRHKCSGMIVCPEDDNAVYNKKMLLKKKCNMETAKHERLSSKSLRNIKTRFCVHPSGGKANENKHLVYWRGCNEPRLALDFLKL